MRIATWNIKQAVAPKKPLDRLWAWAGEQIQPDVLVLTEAKVPKGGVPSGWSAVWDPAGVGPRQRWGTVVAGRGVDLRPVTEVKSGIRRHTLSVEWPAAVQVVDIMQGAERWATLVGFYAVTRDRNGESCGHGRYSTPLMLKQLDALFRSDRAQRLIVAGDLNMWPSEIPGYFQHLGLVDLVDATASNRRPDRECADCTHLGRRCGHLWTHKNGNSPNAAVQQIDYVLASTALAREVGRVYGGVGHFADAWDVSDHAPVVAEFR